MSAAPARVVITGWGVLAVAGDSPQALMSAWREGRVPGGDCDAAPLPDFEPRCYLGDGNLRPLDRVGRLAASAVHLALADGGLSTPEARTEPLGLVLGTMYGGLATVAAFDRRGMEAGPLYVKPFDFANSVINAAAGQTAIWHHLEGVNATVASGLVSGHQALLQGRELVAGGRSRRLLAGGAEELAAEAADAFRAAGYLRRKRRVDTGSSASYAVLGEGAAVVLLEEEDSACRRSVRIRGELLGAGVAFAAEGDAAAAMTRATTAALAEAGIGPGELSAAVLAAVGIPGLDRAEAEGVAAAMESESGRTPVSALGQVTGIVPGAGGVLQAIALLAALGEGVLPPAPPWLRDLAPKSSLDTAATLRPLSPGPGLVTGLDLEGSAVALVVAPPRGPGGEEGP